MSPSQTVCCDAGKYVPSKLENEVGVVQAKEAEAASRRKLFREIKGLQVSAIFQQTIAGDENNVDEIDLDSHSDDEGYWDRQRLQPVDPFERSLFYRVDHSGSRFEDADGDLLARLPPPQDTQHISESLMREWVNLHARLRNQRLPTPFISVTKELLRAINLAEHLRARRCEDIRILLIDGSSLSKNSDRFSQRSSTEEGGRCDLCWQCGRGRLLPEYMAVWRKWGRSLSSVD